MASPFTADQPFKENNVINESERSVDPADDVGKLVQLEADGYLSPEFIDFERSILQNNSPVVESTQTTAVASSITSHVITMPTGVVTGDLLIAIFRNGGSLVTHTPSAGWTLITSTTNINGRLSVFARVATSSNSLTVTTSGGVESATITYRISNAYPSLNAGNVVFGNATGSAIPPVIEGPLSIKNYLWIAVISSRSNSVASAPPTNYSDLISFRSAGGAGSARAMVATAIRGRRTLTEGGGAFTITGLDSEIACSIGIRPNFVNGKWDL